MTKKIKLSEYRRVKIRKGLTISKGDLVEFKWWDDKKRSNVKCKGIIVTIGPEWPCISKHAEILNRIVPFGYILQVIKKRVIDPKWIKYL